VLDLRCGVLINRAGVGDAETRAYCSARRIPILAELPEDRRIAEASSRGELWAGAAADFDVLLAAVLAQAQGRGR
jgi:MinD superfamily P-loop ATPase